MIISYLSSVICWMLHWLGCNVFDLSREGPGGFKKDCFVGNSVFEWSITSPALYVDWRDDSFLSLMCCWIITLAYNGYMFSDVFLKGIVQPKKKMLSSNNVI